MDTAKSLPLPAELRRQFDTLERRLWRIDVVIAVCGALLALASSYALQFISDRLWDTPPWMRACFTTMGLALFGYFAWFYGSRWVWGRRSFETLASLVQKRYRRLGDRLLGIVELADESKRPADVSSALCEAAIKQVAREANRFDFQEAVVTTRSKRYFWALLVVITLVAMPWLLAPQASWNALKRWMWPAAQVERYTFVSLQELPDRLVVPHGEPFEIACALGQQSFWRPAKASAQFENQPVVDAPIEGGKALFRIPGQTQTGKLALRVGDVTRSITIEPVYRPALKELIAEIMLPAYLQYPPQREKIQNNSLTLLKGSQVTFAGKTTRPLRTAVIEGKEHQQLVVSGDTFRGEKLKLEKPQELTFSWKDEFGLDTAAPWKLSVQQKEDLAPEVETRGIAAAVAILEEEVLHIDVSSQDDFGVRSLGVKWEVAEKTDRTIASVAEKRELAPGQPQSKQLAGSFDFSPKLLRIPGDSIVTLTATAVDYFPDRVPAESTRHLIYVLSREAHARLIQEQFEKLLAQLEGLARKEETLEQQGKETRAQKPEELANEKSAEKLGEQSQEQKEIAKQLEDLAKQGAETMKEALRNPDLSEKSLSEWAKTLEEMSKLSKGEMQEASQSLSQSQQSPGERSNKLDEALAKEEEILAKMREMQQQGEKNLDQITAENMAMRLRKLAAAEKGIAGDFRAILPETVGMRAEDLPEKPKGVVKKISGSQEATRKDATQLEEEIGRFFSRTRLNRYGDVAEEMKTAKIDPALIDLNQLIVTNTAVRAIQGAEDWEKRFNDWADRLSQKDDSQSPPNESQPLSERQMQMLMELFRIRQKEDSLRQQTRALDRRQDENEFYKEEAKGLANTQTGLIENTSKLASDPEFPIKPQAMKLVTDTMGEAEALLKKPDTGKETVAVETDVINLIDFLLMGDGGGGGGGGAMAALMQMMGMGAGNSPGGSNAGGTTDRENVFIKGSRAGAETGPRTVEQASGGKGQQVPAEFRDALEGYYSALEGK